MEPSKEDLARWAHLWGLEGVYTMSSETYELREKLRAWRAALSDEQEKLICDYILKVVSE